jgi:NADH-quinone oxidoreductase subunit J
MGAVIGLVLLVELMVVVGGWAFSPEAAALSAAPTPEITQMTNTHAIGSLLYTKYIYLFQAAGMVLLVAMIGAIVLTHRQREGVRKQNINEQVTRSSKDVELRDVEVGKGI